ncbi:two-component system sensor histidine kinase NtrB, partial [Macromonas nakdongensis]|uniref:two-component system sensor histidine kinase NtrB n=1 Tax=Macromonas nakdongensis TaxID=1843082 RepID=UPI0012FF30FD
LQDQPALAPRAFFAAALVCLLGMAAALAFLWRDVAQRRRAESRLRTQMALRSAMERSVALGLRAWDMDGRLLFVNQAFCQLVGWSAAELLGRTGPGPHWPPDQGEEWGPPGDAGREGREVRLRHRDGHGLDVLLHTAPLTQPDGRQIGWIGSVLDITERKRIERLAAQQQEQLEASGRLVVVGEVASTLAHELNQPLGALSSFATGLLNRLQAGRIGADEIVPVVERMARMADKAGRVIQRVNAFARRQEMTRQPLALNGFVRRVVAQVHGPEGVALALKPPATDPVLPADALLLEHALHNLVLNALEWAGQGPSGPARVRVSWWATEAEAAVRVEDSGPGVPPEQHAQVFEAFHSRKPGGMGMGLAICRSIVEAHHGRIEVGRSATLGGAQFTLWLPLNP